MLYVRCKGPFAAVVEGDRCETERFLCCVERYFSFSLCSLLLLLPLVGERHYNVRRLGTIARSARQPHRRRLHGGRAARGRTQTTKTHS